MPGSLAVRSSRKADTRCPTKLRFPRLPAPTGKTLTILILMMKKFSLALLLAACFVAGSAMDARAQVTDLDRSRYSPAAYYNYSEPGDVTILVSVWGTVRNPGL